MENMKKNIIDIAIYLLICFKNKNTILQINNKNKSNIFVLIDLGLIINNKMIQISNELKYVTVKFFIIFLFRIQILIKNSIKTINNNKMATLTLRFKVIYAYC